MASLKELRSRIASVESTKTITAAMKMIAAARLRQAEEAAVAARPYAEQMEAVLASLASGVADDGPELLIGNGKDKVHLLIVATSERGLCGGFNSTIVRLARQRIEALLADGKDVRIFCIGKKGMDQLKRQHSSRIVETVFMDTSRRLDFGVAQGISARVAEMFEAGEFDVCSIFYNKYQNVMTQIPTHQQIIPATLPDSQDEAAPDDNADAGLAAYEYEPDEQDILAALLPRNLTVQIYRALLENAASEMGSKMTAMDSATRNAEDMVSRLTTTYNRSRQAQITKELIEIISGAEAI